MYNELNAGNSKLDEASCDSIYSYIKKRPDSPIEHAFIQNQSF